MHSIQQRHKQECRCCRVLHCGPLLWGRLSDYDFGSVVRDVGEWVVANLSGRIDALEQRLKQLKVKQQRVEARKRSLEAKRTRREELRRKILVGAVVLAKVEQGGLEQSTLYEWLDAALTRGEDRKLFGLSTAD